MGGGVVLYAQDIVGRGDIGKQCRNNDGDADEMKATKGETSTLRGTSEQLRSKGHREQAQYTPGHVQCGVKLQQSFTKLPR